MTERPIILPGRLFEWAGLRFERDEQADCFRAEDGDFKWEVDTSLDGEDGHGRRDLYQARLYIKGLKSVTGTGESRHSALSSALSNLQKLEGSIATQVVRRREAQRGHKGSTVRYSRGE